MRSRSRYLDFDGDEKYCMKCHLLRVKSKLKNVKTELKELKKHAFSCKKETNEYSKQKKRTEILKKEAKALILLVPFIQKMVQISDLMT